MLGKVNQFCESLQKEVPEIQKALDFAKEESKIDQTARGKLKIEPLSKIQMRKVEGDMLVRLEVQRRYKMIADLQLLK